MINRRGFLGVAMTGAMVPRLDLSRRVPSIQDVQRVAADTPYWLEASGTPGLSVAWLEDGRFKETRSFGSNAPGGGTPITEATIFQTASLSKQAMLYIVLKTVEAGKLDLDRPLVSYMEKSPLEPETGVGGITARHVLTHTTGWPNWPPNEGPFRPVRPMGTWGYSGAGFMLLMEALQSIHGEPAVQYTRRLLLDPLGMKESSFVWRPEYDTSATRGHNGDGSASNPWKPERPNGASSLHSTSREFARLLEAFLDRGMMSKHPEVYRQQVAIDSRLGWSLGWGTSRGMLWQWGHSDGFKTFVALDPGRRRGIVCLANGEAGQRINRAWVNAWLDRDVDAFYFKWVSL
jgi:CubicO group peptidase (beta-lactamase class C family)